MAAIDDLKSVMEGLLAEADSQGGTIVLSREGLLELGIIVSHVEDEINEEPVPMRYRSPRPTIISSSLSSATFTMSSEYNQPVTHRRTQIREEDLPQFPVEYEWEEAPIVDSLRYASTRFQDLGSVTRRTRESMRKLAAIVKEQINPKKKKLKKQLRHPAKRAKKKFVNTTEDQGITPRKVKCHG